MQGGDALRRNHLAQVLRVFMPARARHDQACTGEQWPEELPHRYVEAERGFLQDRIAGSEPVFVLHPQQAVDHPRVFVDHALGLAGGTGGVDHVGGHAGHIEVAGGLVLPGGLIQIDHRHCAQQTQGAALGQHRRRCAVLQHVGDTLQRVRRVDRHIGGASLENGVQADDHVQATLHADRHPRLRLHTEGLQVMGQLVGAGVQFGIGQLLFTGREGRRIWRAQYLGFKQPVQGLVEVVSHGGVVEIDQQLLTLALIHQRHMLQHRLVVSDHGLQHAGEVADVTLHGRLIEQRHGIFQRAEDAALHFPQVQRQVELGEVAVLDNAFQGQIAQRQGRRAAVLPAQQRLEQRAMRQAARRAGDFHHLLKWQVLMGLGRQGQRLDPRQQHLGAQLAGGVDTQRQGVDEQADQPFHLGTRAVGHRCADHHVLLAGQAREQRGPGTHQRHVQRAAMALAQGLEPGREAFIQAHFDAAAGVVLLRRARAVGGQGQQRRRTGQGLLPIGALAVQHFAAQPQALPHGKIGVLDRQGRQGVGVAVAEGLVQRHQLAGQYAHGPAIGDDMVQGQQQHMVIVGHHHQAPAQQRATLKVERRRGFAMD